MPRTLADYRSIVEAALGGEVDDRLDVDAIINDAGIEFVGAHEWKFLERPSTTLDFTAGVGYVDFPSDFGQLVAIEATEDNPYAFQLVDYDTFARYQSTGFLGEPGGSFGTIVHPGQTSTSAAAGAARLLLYPTPTSNVDDALRIFYRAGWTTLSSDGSVPNFPAYCEPVFVQFVRAFAFGSEEQDQGTVEQRLESIMSSSMFRRLVDRSDSVQHDYGPERNGAIGSVLSVDFVSDTPSAPS